MKVLKRTPEYLENRIRELEAELHMEQMRVHDLKQDMEEGLDYLRVREQQLEIEKARAEKAEEALRMMSAGDPWKQVEHLKARVAELETKIRFYESNYPEWSGEAREREEC